MMSTSQDTFPHGAAHLYILLMDCLEWDSFNWTKCFNRHFTECQPVIAVLCIAEEDSPANITVCSITGDKQKHRGAIHSDGKDNKSIFHHFGVAQIKRRILRKVIVGHTQEDIDHRCPGI
ncbi:uncharacterized protein LOC128227389 [Mya arenaria]|uniref:uncharacterized protein LOC128227388 n=1 Tax=Mya arenaria TaxID=6604 RepID=UPI0022E5BF74|nr:uncharacterized protein LOC128227388 [Mya arenaria]XP_052793849.1 uncharacterized protein LOC128227389 [Mya arenaria]